MSKNILIILGHPDGDSFCGALANRYEQAARTAGHIVKRFDLGSFKFDPILHHGYKQIQELEADLLTAQTAIIEAQHLVFIYPIWWGGIPALLKGFFDRVFLPGFAFKYRENSPLWDKLLKGRSAQCLVTLDSPVWYFRWISRMPGHNQMKRTILEFCGISPVKIYSFAPVKTSNDKQREKWLRIAEKAARI